MKAIAELDQRLAIAGLDDAESSVIWSKVCKVRYELPNLTVHGDADARFHGSNL